MSVTILGENIRLIRPEKVKKPVKCKVWKSAKCRCKTIKEHCGKVVSICIKLINEEVFEVEKGTHADVLIKYDISPWYVKKSGWKLDNGNYVWR